MTATVNYTPIELALRARLLATPGLPAARAWENVAYTPTVGVPYVEEQFDPGNAFVPEVGIGARREARPIYAVIVYVPQGTGISAGDTIADAILNQFPPGLVLTCGDGTQLCVSSSPAPSKGTRRYDRTGWAATAVTIPLYTLN